MWYKFKMWWNNPAGNLWVMPAVGAIFATVWSLIATASRYFIDPDQVPDISIEAVENLLDIISSSMLAVTTFSLSIMVAAFASASSSGTPRAYSLMMSDDNTRLAIASFISAFIYAVIAKIALALGYYGPSGRFILFVSTILVLMYLIYTLIRWVQTLSQLGTLTTTIGKIEAVAKRSLAQFRHQPDMGARGIKPDTNPVFSVHSECTGYFNNFNIVGLNQLAKEQGLHLHIHQMPGKFIDPLTTLVDVYSNDPLDLEQQKKLQDTILDHMIIETNRSFLQDPRFGVLVMSEVGQKAMSAAINDVGSGISAINALTRVIIDSQPEEDMPRLDCPYISIKIFDIREIIYSTFAPMARDCSTNLELNQRLLKCLSMIYHNVPEAEFKQAAEVMAEQVIQRCLKNFDFQIDRDFLIEEYVGFFPHLPHPNPV